ncbi:hybrid sensor histidine kinase/response regulator [filamentous cyanobacterium CCP5]|nr:hybrid sensor histidine kinase/response regulator [filamentous cyanobacterium CCP5]
MQHLLTGLFLAGGYIPHGHCYLWQPSLVWLHILSDSLIAIAYFSIPITLLYLLKKRQDWPFNRIFVLFALFIIACGTTHITAVWTLWYPTYWLSGTIKALTALISVVTAVELVKLVPPALTLPSPAQLTAANQTLQEQIRERLQAEERLRQSQDELEQRVQDRTAELVKANHRLQAEIVDRQRHQEALTASETRYRELIEDAPDAILIADSSGKFIDVNTNACRLMGYPEGVLVGMTYDQILVPQELDRMAAVRSQLQAGMTQVAEWHMVRRDNTEIPVEISTKIHADGRWQSFIRDISARRATQAKIRETEARLRSFVDANVIGILFGDIHGAIYDANDELLRIIGYTRAELVSGQINWTDLTPPEYLPLDQEHIQEAQTRGGCTPYEKEYICKNGQRVPVLLGYTLLGQQRDETVAFVLDLTRQKQTEAERDHLLHREQLARQEAEAANRTKDEFLAVLSHELRTPLNPILGWATLLRSRQVDGAALDKGLDAIERNIRLQLQLIDDLLDVSRIIQGKLKMTMEIVNLAEVIRAAMEAVELSAEAKGITLETHFPSEATTVLGDAVRLQQVFWNLLTNAVKFTPQGGQVVVHLNSTASTADIQVVDTGRGIKPEFLPYVFDYFRQEDGTTIRQFGGLGLGLALVRYLSEMHGGTVTASSLGKDQGSTFTVSLPLLNKVPEWLDPSGRTSPSSDRRLSWAKLPRLDGIEILVVEDEGDSRRFIQFLFQQQGAEVAAFEAAPAALDYLSTASPDLLISDIGMPGMDGYMLMEEIRQRFPDDHRLPAIALTAYVGDLDQQRVKAAGFDRHLGKPFDPQQLIQAVADLLPVAQSSSLS